MLITLLHVSGLKGPSSGSTDKFHEQVQQITCPNVNIWKSKHIYKLVVLTLKYKIVTSVHEYEQFNFKL
jgi:hypothetical protein